MSCDGEGKTHIHSAAVAFHRSIQKLFDFGEGDDFVKLPADFGACHAQNGAIQKNVFAAGKLGMKTGTNLEQTRDSTTNADAPFGGLRNAAEDLQKSRLAAAIAADDAHYLASTNFEIDVAERPDIFAGITLDGDVSAK